MLVQNLARGIPLTGSLDSEGDSEGDGAGGGTRPDAGVVVTACAILGGARSRGCCTGEETCLSCEVRTRGAESGVSLREGPDDPPAERLPSFMDGRFGVKLALFKVVC